MSDDTSGKSVTTGTQSGDPVTETITVDHSPEEQARRLVELSAENKKYRQKASSIETQFQETQRKLKDLEDERLKEQGKWQQAYEAEKKRASELAEQQKQDRAKFVYRSVTSQFATEAAKAGCSKVDDLIKLAQADGILNELEVSEEDFSVAPDSLKSAIDKAQKAYPYLYAKPTPTVRDGVPNSNQTTAKGERDLSKMKIEELVAMAKQLPSQ
jgi:membrane protein involved in colicin uptake